MRRMERQLYRWIYSRSVYPLYHSIIRSGALRRIRELDLHDRLSRDELGKIEQEKLHSLLLYARSNVPYYRNVIPADILSDPAGIDDDAFRAIPILTKDVIRRELQGLVSESLEGNRLDANSTSGSTGSPLTFFTDTRSKSYRKAAVVRNRRWLGIEVGDPVARLWGSAIDEKRAESFRGCLHSRVTRELFLSAYRLDDAHLASYASRIRQHKAKLLIAYPSVLVEFGRFCHRNSLDLPSLEAIICSAECLHSHQREAIENYLSTPVYNRYGCREVGDIAHEVPDSEGLFVNSDRIHIEIIDSAGKPCVPGEVGDILVTDLDNYGMPLIRYFIGDRGSWSPGTGNHGRLPYPVLEKVEGRSLDLVVCPSGNRVGGTFWTILLRNRPGIENFKVVQMSLHSLCIEFTRLQDAPEIDYAYFREKIAETCGPQMNVEFKEVSNLSASPGEKFRLVVSEVRDAVSDGDDESRSLQ